ncbi:hypothetical protein [Planococcus beigongshangi]|uniref:hypothetical protein n=1 Tax=Planococcus beigongshangi TaxID=2782536 RepID=UPI00193B3913|nr:hypothetical protein [Planococcus beigongshangi]
MIEEIYVNYGDIAATIILLGTMAVLFFLFFKVIKAFKRDAKKANERLENEKENTLLLQKRIDDLNERVEVIEKKLSMGE